MAPLAPARLRGLLDATHPLPTLAVTTVVTALALAAGRDRAGVVLTGLAVLSGQASVGWCNDARDAHRDLGAGRTEKPTVRGDVSASLLWRAAVLALLVSVALSYVAAGPIGGSAHVVAVLSAWAYNLALKTTVASALPYAVSFGLVPAFVTYGLTPPTAPTIWVTATCALMGVGAHLANALPDVDSDRSVGAGGLVASIGPRAATVVALGCLVAAISLLASHLAVSAVVAGAIIAVTTAGAAMIAVRGRGRALFRFVVLLAVAAVAMLLVAATSLTS
jgi:4-hydroxybenzoate polyprenyltransferase